MTLICSQSQRSQFQNVQVFDPDVLNSYSFTYDSQLHQKKQITVNLHTCGSGEKVNFNLGLHGK